MQTALHIMSLVRQLKDEIIDGRVTATEFYRKERAVYFIIKKKQRLALGFVYHPVKWGTYLIPASKAAPDTREKPRSVFELEDGTITDVTQLGMDRIFSIKIEKDNLARKVIIEALGPNGNIWLLDEKDNMLASLRKKQFTIGQPYSFTPLKDKFNPLDVDSGLLKERLKSAGELPVRLFIERNFTGFSPALAREIVHRASLADTAAGDMDDDETASLLESIDRIAKSFADPQAGYVYVIAGRHEAYPLKLSCIDEQPEKHKSLSLAAHVAAEIRSSVAEQEDEEKTVTDAVGRAIKRLKKRLDNLEKDIEKASDYEHYRRLGELLQINYGRIKKGMDSIEVEDVYSDTDETVAIKLDPALSPQENSEAYFKRYRKGRDGLDLLQRRLEITRQELQELNTIGNALGKNFDSARRKYEQEIISLLPGQATGIQAAPRLPYRPYKLSTGLTIFVGRDGADNDRTTFEFAKPYELWFHTQQCAGSHVVIKFPNKSFEPSKAEIEETAAIAAWFSKARNDSLVPVIFTQRKYVRKPRKAKPGLVTVEREKSVMVVPSKPGPEE